jgi:glycogen phosphorylase
MRTPSASNYLSAEFLLGRMLLNNLISLGLLEEVKRISSDLGVDLGPILEEEPDAGLGNGGLGRLAACFLDSMATLGIPAVGYGIRYEFGIFEQAIRNGYQVEKPDEWLRFGNPWEFPRPDQVVRVRFNGHVERYNDEQGKLRTRWVDTHDVLGVPYDTPILGYGRTNVNSLRLWSARSSSEFDLAVFNSGDYERAVYDKTRSETISKVLYPNDSVQVGRELRLRQQYFFVACSIADIVRRYRHMHDTFDLFPQKVAIQLNDTHPSIAIPELMRVLVDEHQLPWEKAWAVTQATFAYTNHTLMSEALERWSVELFERLLPRHLEIIYEINARFLRTVQIRFPGDGERMRRMSLIEEGTSKNVRMANLAVVGSHSVNGVSELHTQLLRKDVLSDFGDMFPERFNNKTNGVTPRRWLLQCNPRLSALLDARLGRDWPKDLDRLSELAKFADDPSTQDEFLAGKHANKDALAQHLADTLSLGLDPSTIFDVQVKRIHEYKRQLLNALSIIALYLRCRRGSVIPAPVTFLFGGKAAPGYIVAKLIIRLVNGIAEVVNETPGETPLAVHFIPNYRVSLAERIIPAADLSEQISTAGTEASGTGNMKFALNGALTLGTLDGANIEIREAVGHDAFFLFGLTADEVRQKKADGYRPAEYAAADPELAEVLELVRGGMFSPEDRTLFRDLVDGLLRSDPYFVLADFRAYMDARVAAIATYADRRKWASLAIRNIAGSGPFSSDRTIHEYARDIWKATTVDVVVPPYVSDADKSDASLIARRGEGPEDQPPRRQGRQQRRGAAPSPLLLSWRLRRLGGSPLPGSRSAEDRATTPVRTKARAHDRVLRGGFERHRLTLGGANGGERDPDRAPYRGVGREPGLFGEGALQDLAGAEQPEQQCVRRNGHLAQRDDVHRERRRTHVETGGPLFPQARPNQPGEGLRHVRADDPRLRHDRPRLPRRRFPPAQLPHGECEAQSFPRVFELGRSVE